MFFNHNIQFNCQTKILNVLKLKFAIFLQIQIEIIYTYGIHNLTKN